MEAIKGLFGSKKFLAAIAGLLAAAGVQFVGLDEATADKLSLAIVGLIGTYIAGQGMADFGKEKAKIE